MAEIIANLVYETSVTSGTGALSLDPVSGYQSFVAGVGDGNTCRYCVSDGVDFEVGIGTVSAGTPNTLSRDRVEMSSNANALVNFGTAEKKVYHAVTAEMLNEMYQSGRVYGIRFDQANDIVEKGVLVSGVFVPTDYGAGEIQKTLARVLREPVSGAVHALHPDDSNFLIDGTTSAVFDGSMGDVQVRIPAHHQLWHKNGDYRYILMSWQPFAFEGVASWQPLCFQGKKYYYMDAFRGVRYDDAAGALVGGQGETADAADTVNDVCRSLPGYRPWVYEKRSSYRQLFSNRTSSFQNMWDARQMLAGLFYAEYGDLNSQAVLPGYTEGASGIDFAFVRKTGRTLALGNASGSVAVDFAGEDADLQPAVAGGGSDWTESGATAGEFYYTGDLVPGKPVKVFVDGVEINEGTPGSLLSPQWGYGDNDLLGSDALYLKLASGDPDNLAAGTVSVRLSVDDGDIVANSYRGIEDPFGGIYEFVDGMNIDNTTGDCHVYTCTDPAKFADDVDETADGYVDTGHAPGFGEDDGYISDILGEGRHCPYYPAAIAGSSASFLYDYHYNAGGAWRVARVGGALARRAAAGLACLNAHIASGYRHALIGSRGAAVSDE